MIELPSFITRLYPYRPRFAATVFGRMHYVDEGEGRPVLLVHGNPTWSFLYRKVMAGLAGGPYRVVAPDLIGLGLSDKPRELSAHTLRRHGESLLELVQGLELKDVVLVVQDWGGPMGAWMAARAGGRVTGLVVMNTALLKPERF